MDYAQELKIAIVAAKAAGAAVRVRYDTQNFSVHHKAGDKGPLTEADLESNAILERHLRGAFPDDGWLSEESVDQPRRLAKRRVWIIDPIDGTREFTMGVPEFVVSVGLAVDGLPVLGVLYNPATEELFTGVVGLGATYNGAPCRVSEATQLKGARLLVSRSEHKKGWFNAIADEATLIPMGSVAYKFGRVAAGLAEASFTPKPRNEWDLIAGVACILAASGRANDGAGQPYRFNRADPLHHGVIGTNAAIHPVITALMEQL